MTRGEFDANDALGLPLFIIASLISLELYDPTLLAFMQDTLVVLPGDAPVSLAKAVALSSLTGVLYSNDIGVRGLTGVDIYIVLATFGLILAPPYLPILEEWVTHGIGASVAFTVQTMGYASASYIE